MFNVRFANDCERRALCELSVEDKAEPGRCVSEAG